MTALATVTLQAATPTVTFSGIPQGYRDLVLVVVDAKSLSSNPAVFVRFNSDSGANYSYVRMTGNGSTAGSASTSSQTRMDVGAAFGVNSTENAMLVLQIVDYSSTAKHKTVLSRSGVAGLGVEAIASRWASNSAVTAIQIFLDSSISWTTGTTFSLYGRIA